MFNFDPKAVKKGVPCDPDPEAHPNPWNSLFKGIDTGYYAMLLSFWIEKNLIDVIFSLIDE